MDICYECQEPTVKKQGPVTLTKTGYGSYEVPGVIHFACDKCGVKIIPPEETERVEVEGVKLHILKVLSCEGVMNALTLKEKVRSTVDNLELAAMQLIKAKKINIDYTDPNEPVLSIGEGEIKKLSAWQRLKNWVSKNKHNFY